MFYLSVPFKLCLLLFPVSLLLSSVGAASAEDKIALSFDLPPAQSAPQPLVRYEESLPPIESAPVEPAPVEPTPSITDSPVTLPGPGAMAVQFDRDEIALPDVEEQPPVYEVGTEAVRNEDIVQNISALDDWIFEGGSDSLVARTVGSAEGTRRWDGGRTMAYYGHVDPGNGVWNQGTFSYQHEASSPEDADEKQLRRLQRQERQLKEKAAHWRVPLSLEVRLNGLDLANQAPLAALDKGGYIERLAEAYREGKSGEQAIAWARTQAYFDPDKRAWDAPGLGNNHYSIRRDQERRMAAIDKAFRAFNHDYVDVAKLPDIHIEGAAAGSPLSGQSGHIVVDATLSAEGVSFTFPDSESTTLAEVASQAVDVEAEVVFEDDVVELGEWDETAEAVASDTLGLIEQETVIAEQVEDYVDEGGRAIATTDLGVELEQTYRAVEDELSIDELPVDELPMDEVSVDDLPDDLPVNEVSVNQVSVDDPSVDNLSVADSLSAIESMPEQAAETQKARLVDRLVQGVLPREHRSK